MNLGGLLYLASIVAFAIVAIGIWAFDMEVRDAVALTGAGLACLAAGGGPWWGARRL